MTSALGRLPGVEVRSRDGFPNIGLNTCRVSLTSRRVAHAWMGDARRIIDVNASDTICNLSL